MFEKKANRPPGGPTSRDVYKNMNNTMLTKATDWVTELGGAGKAFLWLFYGCTECMMYPIRSSDWYRCTRNVKGDEIGDTQGVRTSAFGIARSASHAGPGEGPAPNVSS